MPHSHSEESNRPKDAMDAGQNLVHGAGDDQNISSKVDRADKAAPVPDHEPGAGIPGMSAGAGHSQGLSQGPTVGQGKGPK